MLTKLTIRNFKKFTHADIELGSPVVFVGPNNSGKTTALQALALWEIGLKRWNEKRRGREAPEKRPGVTINRQDLIAIPVPDANLLWRGLHVRDVTTAAGAQKTKNIRIEIVVEGITQGEQWRCGLEFDYANPESFYCRPLRTSEDPSSPRMAVPDHAGEVHVAYLPPMSGLAATETLLVTGAINVRLGEGRTAEVLRNLCYQIISFPDGKERWERLTTRTRSLFGVELEPPEYVAERGEITMSYRQGAVDLDLSSAGRGLQQTLLLLSHMDVNRGAVLVMDEPDAHLEFLRQRQTYQLLTDVARETGSQIIAASHSEVVLNEAADRDIVVAFVGAPHRIDDRGRQVLKALKEIGFDDYVQVEQKGWALYVEGSTDLAILKAFADILGHPAARDLERVFVHYSADQPNRVRDHFYGLREARGDLVGIALFDRIDRQLQNRLELRERMWTKREIENYLSQRETLLAWAEAEGSGREGTLLGLRWRPAMEEAIAEVEQALRTLGKSPWSNDIKASDEFLDPLFQRFFEKLGLNTLMYKNDYYVLARHVPKDLIDQEVGEVLDAIHEVAAAARPADED